MDLSGLLREIEQAPGFRELRARLSAREGRIIAGLSDAAKPPALAVLLRDETAPVVIVTARPAKARLLTEELPAWLGDQARVCLFPERDVLPYERLAADPKTVRDRITALTALAANRPAIVIASALAVSQRTLSPDDMRAVLRVRIGEKLDLEDLLRDLDVLGYENEADGRGNRPASASVAASSTSSRRRPTTPSASSSSATKSRASATSTPPPNARSRRSTKRRSARRRKSRGPASRRRWST